MSGAILTSPPIATARLVVDTDVASFVFKWHPEFAPSYVAILRGSELVVSFMTLAEMRQGALEANWGRRKCDVLEDVFGRLLSAPFRQPAVLYVGRGTA
jgi:predicted nucleic acid-binding protein